VGGPANSAVFRRLRNGNSFEETLECLLTAIKLGVVAPGERLPPERELAERLNVSRQTLREATRELQRAGFTESRRGRYGGTFVNPAPPHTALPIVPIAATDLDDMLVLREVLEVGAAGQAASRTLAPAERDDLTRRLRECASVCDHSDYRRLDSRLHLAIAEATASASLTTAVAATRMRVNALLDAIPMLERNVRHSDDQHARIVTAILEGRPVLARAAMADHLHATAALLRGFLSSPLSVS
jgi:GntR family L-lactate dehydrogenase operon transcriptional regulator